MTIEELKEFGMIETKDNPAVSFNKDITLPDEDGNCLCISVQHYYNTPMLSIITPSGDMIHLGGVQNIDDLRTIERLISGWEPNN